MRAGGGRGGAVGVVRRRGLRVVRGRGGRRRELRRADRGDGPRVPPSPLAARALDRPAPLRAARGDGAARDHADRRPPQAGRRDRRCGRHRRRRDGDARPRGPHPARLGHLCRRCAAHGPRGRAVAAAERDRVARLGRHDLRRQDRDADDGLAPPRRGAAGAGHERRGARRGARPLRGLLRGPEPDAERDRSGAARDARSRSTRPCRSSPAGGGAARRSAASATCSARPSSSRSGSWPRSPPRTRKPAAASSASASATAPSRRIPTPARPRCGRSGSRCSPRSCGPRRAETIAFLLEQGVEVVVLSGDAAGDGGLDRDGRRHPGSRAAARRRGAARGRCRARPALGLAVGRRPHLAGGKAAGRRVAAPQRPLRGDGRGRRQRRPGAEGVAPLDRAGLGNADGQGRLRHRARQRRLRGDPGDGRRGPPDPPQHPAGDEALRHQVGLRRIRDRRDRDHSRPTTRCFPAT